MLITIFADASHCPHTKAAGWGAWAKGDGWKQGVTFGGSLGIRTNNSAEAELAAIASAVRTLFNNDSMRKYDAVMIQSDSLRALQVIYHALDTCHIANHSEGAPIPYTAQLTLSPAEKKTADNLVELLRGRMVYVRHVRGHQRGGGRSWVNRTCDEIARRGMIKQTRKRRKKHS